MSKKTSSSAFALSLAGGILIILGSIVSLLFFANLQSSMQDRMGGMMGGMMGGWFLSIPVVAGILVIVGAEMINARPQETALEYNHYNILNRRLYRNGAFLLWLHPRDYRWCVSI